LKRERYLTTGNVLRINVVTDNGVREHCMTILRVSAHNDVPPSTPHRLPTGSSGVCRCGAVFDYGNVAAFVPAEFLGMCGRCAFKRGLRPGSFTSAETRWTGTFARAS
jgi:hypothetical protein